MLAIIPARGGSKGLPGKNIKTFHGKPLIAYSIETAKASELFKEIVVSTDSEEIADIAMKCGADVPFLRPPHLATDTAHAIDAFLHTVDHLNNKREVTYNEFVVLQPTSPLRLTNDIIDAVAIYRERRADSVISVTVANHPPSWAKKINKQGVLENFLDDDIDNRNRQENEVTYVPNGAVFVLRVELLRNYDTYYSKKTYPFIMPKERSIDIDDQVDFVVAEFLYEKLFLINKPVL